MLEELLVGDVLPCTVETALERVLLARRDVPSTAPADVDVILVEQRPSRMVALCVVLFSTPLRLEGVLHKATAQVQA